MTITNTQNHKRRNRRISSRYGSTLTNRGGIWGAIFTYRDALTPNSTTELYINWMLS